MTVWIVLGSVSLVLVLIGMIPVGIDAVWNGESGALAAQIGFFKIRLGGKKKDPEGVSRDEKSASRGKNTPELPVLRILLRNGYHTLCRLVSRLRISTLKIHFTSAFEDPAVSAMAYAAAGTAMDGLLHIGGTRIQHPDLRAMVDFDGRTPAVDFHIRLNLRVHQSLREALVFGVRFLRDYMRYKRKDGKHGKSDR